jgi:hypothetical protein
MKHDNSSLYLSCSYYRKNGETKMIDKKSQKWQSAPFWVTLGLWGFKERKNSIVMLICGVGFYLNDGWGQPTELSSLLWCSAYLLAVVWFALAVRWVDKKGMWQ